MVFDFTGSVFGFLGGGTEWDVFAGEGEDVHVRGPCSGGIVLIYVCVGAF